MTYKYEDLVVIPKSVLGGYEILKPLAKPLLPIVEEDMIGLIDFISRLSLDYVEETSNEELLKEYLKNKKK